MKLFLILAGALLFTSCAEIKPDSDKDRYDRWLSDNRHREDISAFEHFLRSESAADIVPLYQLLRNDRNWQRCGQEPFAVPPRQMWPNIVPVLHLLHDKIEPQVGEVMVVSAYRTPQINKCLGGASRSFHMRFYALDLVPTDRSVTRADIAEKLCALHRKEGKKLKLGLGIYKGRRFHIDLSGYRRWGPTYHAGSSPCT